MITVALVGNPNAGKTTIFNALTGSSQQIGNWPGTTVERIEGNFLLCDDTYVRLVDLPGIYSLSAFSIDEKIARDFLLNERPDLVLVVVDSTNLERNLYLLVQIREMGFPVIVVLNMWDMADKMGIKLDADGICKAVGAEKVVFTVGSREIGIDKLREAMIDFVVKKKERQREELRLDYGPQIELILEEGEKRGIKRFELLWLMEMGQDVIDSTGINNVGEDFLKFLRHQLSSFGKDLSLVIAERRYGFIHSLLEEMMTKPSDIHLRLVISEYIDKVVTNGLWGIPIFLLVMYLLFSLVFKVADVPVGWMQALVDYVKNLVLLLGDKFSLSGWFISLLSDGIIDGVGSVIVFLPNIFLLFIGISFLEDSGYLARAAFIMDKFMHKLGLHGKSFIPMLIGFGCNVPAIMATRTLTSEKDRILTSMVIPFMSCSARLPVYILFASVFFPGRENIIVFILYLFGILVGIATAYIFNKVMFQEKESLLIMEMPPYRLPSWKLVLRYSWVRTFEFVKKAGTVILLAVVLIWVLSSFPYGVGYADKLSYLGRIGQVLAPIFSPAGFGFWQAAVALLFGIVAKEVVVGTLGSLLAGGNEESLRDVLPKYFSQGSAFSFLIMTLLYVPCVATIGVLKKELGWRWAIGITFYTILVGWIFSVGFYQLIGKWFL